MLTQIFWNRLPYPALQLLAASRTYSRLTISFYSSHEIRLFTRLTTMIAIKRLANFS